MSIDEKLGHIEATLESIQQQVSVLTDAVNSHMQLHSGDKERIAVLEQLSRESIARSDRRYQLLLVVVGAVVAAILAYVGFH